MKRTKKDIMSFITEKVDEKLQIIGVEHKNDWKYHSYALFISLNDGQYEPMMVVISAQNITQKQYEVFRALQFGLAVYLDGVADDDELLARLINHWFNDSDAWDNDIFSKSDKGILCPYIRAFDPSYSMYTIITNMTFNRARCSIRIGYTA